MQAVLHDQRDSLPPLDDHMVAISLKKTFTAKNDHVEKEPAVRQDTTSSIHHKCRVHHLDAELLVEVESLDIEVAEGHGQPVLTAIRRFDTLPEGVTLAQEFVLQSILEYLVPVNSQSYVVLQVLLEVGHNSPNTRLTG